MLAQPISPWLAALRIALGASFLVSAYLKVVNPAYDTDVLLPNLQRWAIAGPEPFATFVNGVLLPHTSECAFALKAGEVFVGMSLLLGFLTRLGALVGVAIIGGAWVLSGAYARLTGYAGTEFVALVTMVFLLLAPAGAVLAVDRAFARRRPNEPTAPPPIVTPPQPAA
jgi:uncharacterized membrane protein YphA (DoxX/SURF4 family)